METAPKHWVAGLVRRWHNNPDLSHYTDHTAAHSGRMAVIAVRIGWHDILAAIITHDAGEIDCGDMPYPVKKANPELASELSALELCSRFYMGIFVHTTKDQERRIKFLDKLDAYYFAMHYSPHLKDTVEWSDHENWLEIEADSLGVII